MSERHPIIAITGSSGAGTTSVTRTFENIFRRERVDAAVIEGDSFHRFDRGEMKSRQAQAEKDGDRHFSHFGPENNLFGELAQLFRSYAETGQGMRRKYLHDAEEAAPYRQEPGTFTTSIDAGSHPERCSVSSAPASRRSVIKLLNLATTMANFSPVALRFPSIIERRDAPGVWRLGALWDNCSTRPSFYRMALS